MTNLVFTPAEIAKGLAIASDHKSVNPYTISVQRCLNEAGFIQTKQAAGLNKWDRGGFSPPYLYITLRDMVDTLLGEQVTFGKLNNAMQTIQKIKMVTMLNAVWHQGQYVSWTVGERLSNLPKFLWLGPKSTVAMFKGIFNPAGAGAKIKSGHYTYEVGRTEVERDRARKFAIYGSHLVAGFAGYLRNVADKADAGVLPFRQAHGDNMTNYWLSGFGAGPSVLVEVIGEYVLPIMCQMVDKEMAKDPTLSEDDACKRVVQLTNTLAGTLDQANWQGSIDSTVIQWASWSKNFFVRSLRCLIMASMSRKGGMAVGTLLGAAIPHVSFATALAGLTLGTQSPRLSPLVQKFRASGQGAFLNKLTGGTIPPPDRPAVNDAAFWNVVRTAFYLSMLRWTIQYGMSFLSDSEPDIYAKEEKRMDGRPDGTHWPGDPDYYTCKKRNLLFNIGTMRTGLKDAQGFFIDVNFNMDNTFRGIADWLGAFIDSAGRNISHNPWYESGSTNGFVYEMNKLTALDTAIELAHNETHKNSKELMQVYNTAERGQFANAKQFMQQMNFFTGNYAPVQGWVGQSAKKGQMGPNWETDALFRFWQAYGQDYHHELPADKNISPEEALKNKEIEQSMQYKIDHAEKPITQAEWENALAKGTATMSQYKENNKHPASAPETDWYRNKRLIKMFATHPDE